MGWFQFRPYVSVAQRRANAAREIKQRMKKGQVVSPVLIEGKKITTSFWGNSWCENLEAYSDFENRLPRGRTYVRNGSVVHLAIDAGVITALVSGSELYEVKIQIDSLPGTDWKRIKSRCTGQIGSMVELLQGKLSKSVMEVVTKHDEGLFPKPKEIKMRCSCPDSAGMCKHIAAAMYGVGNRLDRQPELLFKLRKVDHLELITGIADAPALDASAKRGKKTVAKTDLADVFGIEMASADGPLEFISVIPRLPKPARKTPTVAGKANKPPVKKTGPAVEAPTVVIPNADEVIAAYIGKSTVKTASSKPPTKPVESRRKRVLAHV